MYVRELNWAEPISTMPRLADEPQLTFLDNALRHEQLGRYSYNAWDRFGTYIVADECASWNGLPGDLFEALHTRLRLYGQAAFPSSVTLLCSQKRTFTDAKAISVLCQTRKSRDSAPTPDA